MAQRADLQGALFTLCSYQAMPPSAIPKTLGYLKALHPVWNKGRTNAGSPSPSAVGSRTCNRPLTTGASVPGRSSQRQVVAARRENAHRSALAAQAGARGTFVLWRGSRRTKPARPRAGIRQNEANVALTGIGKTKPPHGVTKRSHRRELQNEPNRRMGTSASRSRFWQIEPKTPASSLPNRSIAP